MPDRPTPDPENFEHSFDNPTDQIDLENTLQTVASDIPVEDDLDYSAPEEISDLPQEITESYGTGVADLPGYATGGRTMGRRMAQYHEASPELTGGDVDANWEQANAVGDESVGGTVATPDMDIVDDLGKAVGLEMADQTFLRTTELLEQRDDQRWELEPKSAEDYEERRAAE
uniref:Uncharacterized protein n=1 Tax=Cyanothece sp. (strain PCC 7425 / ATCC 29141) TaxID=395961 RepID=B8HKE8_CYAP4